MGTYELKPKESNIKSKILNSLGLSFVMSLIFAVLIYFDEKSIYFSLIVFSISFVFTFILLFFMYKKGQISNVQLKEINPNYKLLLELNYHINDLKIKPIIIMQIIFPIICLITGVFSIMMKEYLISLLSFGLLILFGVVYLLEDFKLKIDCKLTDRGIIIGNVIAKHQMLQWQDINSYELSDGLIYLNVTNLSSKPRFPVLNQKEKIIQILNYYIKKN